jgi:hypothetical protein
MSLIGTSISDSKLICYPSVEGDFDLELDDDDDGDCRWAVPVPIRKWSGTRW